MAREKPSTHTRGAEPRLIAAAHLLAAAEAARRIRNGDQLDDVARYVRIRAERLARDHAPLYAALAACEPPDPLDMARGIDPDLAGPAAAAPATTRTLDDGTVQRFIPGTGWATVR